MLQEEWKCANTEFDWDVKRGIENTVYKKSCPLRRMSLGGELTVLNTTKINCINKNINTKLATLDISYFNNLKRGNRRFISDAFNTIPLLSNNSKK